MKITAQVLILSFISILFSCSRSHKDNNPDIQKLKKVPVFQAWNDAEVTTGETEAEMLAKHAVVFGGMERLAGIHWDWNQSPYSGLRTRLDTSLMPAARIRIAEIRKLNPDIKLLVELRYREGRFVSAQNEATGERGYLPPDSELWLRTTEGKPVIGWGEDTNENGIIDADDKVLSYLVDFTNPEFQQLVVQQAKTIKESGLFDGIMMDWMNENATSDDASIDGWNPYLPDEVELNARINLLENIRKEVGDDFLIIGNTNQRMMSQLAPLLNAAFMENHKPNYRENYTDEELQQIQEAVIFNQTHLHEPKIVCVEGWRVHDVYNPDRNTRIKERNSEVNLQTMRLFTTMTLTLSNGCVLFADDNAIPLADHYHNWYKFWDLPIGKPLGKPGTLYNNIGNLYLREFENAWVVYNFSGTSQSVGFPEKLKDGLTQKVSKNFTVPNKDGMILLKGLSMKTQTE